MDDHIHFLYPKNKVALFLGVDHKSFEKQFSLPLEPRQNGGPSILKQEEKEVLFEKINEYRSKQINKSLSPNTLHNYITDLALFKIIKGETNDERHYFANQNNSMLCIH